MYLAVQLLQPVCASNDRWVRGTDGVLHVSVEPSPAPDKRCTDICCIGQRRSPLNHVRVMCTQPVTPLMADLLQESAVQLLGAVMTSTESQLTSDKMCSDVRSQMQAARPM